MRDSSPISSILIVGGGSAGWLSAAYLNRALGRHVQISLVESSAHLPIGVGESTLPTLGATMRFLGFEERDWMPTVGATYKAAIRFRDWAYPAGSGQTREFWHPFIGRPEPRVMPFGQAHMPEIGEGVALLHYGLKQRLEGDPRPLAELLSAAPELARRKLAPRASPGGRPAVHHAYHVDAGRLGGFLRDAAVGRGVRHIVEEITHVTRDEGGDIAAVHTAGGKALEADLFLDCSGFRGLLINQALGESFDSYGDHLLCDSAVALARAPEPDGRIAPCTTAMGMDSGWCWDVPLFHRGGCGYVYSSAFESRDGAERALRAALGERALGDARHLRMRVGRTRRTWAHNCVAIGLSAGFVEPLEATGIFLVEYGLSLLLTLFPNRSHNPGRQRQYNALMAEMYDDILDFIVLHYWSSRREDTPFWRAAHHEATLPEPLARMLPYLEDGLPVLDAFRTRIFLANSYAFILDGMDHLPRTGHPLLETLGYGDGMQVLAARQRANMETLETLPDHRAFLEALYGDSGPTE